MGRIEKVIAVLLGLTILLSFAKDGQAEQTPDYVRASQWYQAHYAYLLPTDTICTFRTEFPLPADYHWQDSTKQSDYSYWIANLPLWHKWKPVGDAYGHKVMEANQISRAVHLPWKGQYFTDFAIPFRLLGEFLYQAKRPNDFSFLPIKGDPLNYENWLKGRPAFRADGTLIVKPGPARDTSMAEFFQFISFCMQNTNLHNLIQNCDSVSADDLIPGDLFIAHDKDDKDGRVYVLLNVLIGNDGKKLYAVATGCPKACDFHIPLVNDEQDNPWIDLQRLQSLELPQLPESGFFRMKTVNLSK